MHEDEVPLTRLKRHGASTLSDAELLAVLLGTKDLNRSRRIVSDGLYGLSRQAPFTIREGTEQQNARLVAAFEIGRRVHTQPPVNDSPVVNPDLLGRDLVIRHGHKIQEELGALFLNAKNVPIKEVCPIFRGSLTNAYVSPRDIVRIALDYHAAGVIIFHQHPSGSPEPSGEDFDFTRKLESACKLMGIDLLDHIIIGHNRHVSFKQRGFLPS